MQSKYFFFIIILFKILTLVSMKTRLCPRNFNGFRPHPTNCSKYLECYGSRELIHDCPQGLYYDPDIRGCDYDDEKCQRGSASYMENTKNWCDPKLGGFQCPNSYYKICISPNKVCNGYEDCIGGTDEMDCGTPYFDLPKKCENVVASGFRILLGKNSIDAKQPWHASIRVKGSGSLVNTYSHQCGGIIISSIYVLTAAHCIDDMDRTRIYKVVAGDYNIYDYEPSEQVASIIGYTYYEGFHRRGSIPIHDIGLLKLRSPGFQLNKHVKSVCLPSNFVHADYCTVSGFGIAEIGETQSSSILRELPVKMQNFNDCLKKYKLQQGMFCTSDSVTARGDSGGPLTCYQNGISAAYGIVSWGDANHQKGDVYTYIPHYRDWIFNQIRRY